MSTCLLVFPFVDLCFVLNSFFLLLFIDIVSLDLICYLLPRLCILLCLSICLYVCINLYISVYLSIHLSFYLYPCLFLFLFIISSFSLNIFGFRFSLCLFHFLSPPPFAFVTSSYAVGSFISPLFVFALFREREREKKQ